tara:strand:+ start:3814 stop:5013 length:1200 start_codon:yes stop_codon:yes gene_type:complete
MLNNKFTAYGIREIDLKISEDLNFIVSQLVGFLGKDNIQSIILTGSFAKGEGTAYIDNGKVKIVNDYDITIVHYRSFLFKLRNKKKLGILAESLANKINIKQIDFGLLSINNINKVKETISYNDFLFGHILIYGDSPFDESNKKNIFKFSLFEGSWLLRNRGVGLVLAGLYFIGKKNNNFVNKENLWIECNKAKQAIGDSFLITKGLYHFSCKVRYERLKEIHEKENLPFFEWYSESINSKLVFNKNLYTKSLDDMIEEWFIIKKKYSLFFLNYEKSRLDDEFLDWNHYLKLNPTNINFFKMKFLYNFLFSSFKKNNLKLLSSNLNVDKILSIGITGLLLDSITDRMNTNSNINLLTKKFKIRKNNSDGVYNWITIAKFYLLSIHPEGEAKKVAINEKL